MTILPELRDALTRAKPPLILPELRDGLIRARPRRARRRRRAFAGGVALSGLLATAGALAATGVLQTGDPVKPRHVERDPGRGVGVPVGSTARLLPLRVADPAGGPPWGLRLVTTSRGLACLQVGRVVGNELGVLGQDGIAGNDGRFHPLPVATASTPLTPCQIPDGAGRFFVGVDRLTYASGDSTERSCRGRELGNKARTRCPTADERRIGYGLLGPEAASVAFVDGSKLDLAGPEGAYLSVRPGKGEESVVSMGGGPAIDVFGSAVTRIDYRDGTFCPEPRSKRAFCPPKGFTERTPGPKGSVRAPLTVTMGTRKLGAKRVPEIRVRFRAPTAITDAQSMYLFEGRFPDATVQRCRRVIFSMPTNRNIARGDTVRLFGIVPPDCTGMLRAHVLLADITYNNGKPKPAVVGRVSRRFR
jgi:hypothetical protein